MQLKLLALSALASSVLAQAPQSLNATLASNNQTSLLASLLGNYPGLVSTLASATNITVLAPSNNALQTLLNTTAGKALAADAGAVQALLEYHVLKGTYEASAITSMPAFVPTFLTNTSYTNVTGGQVVEAVAVKNNVTFFSGLLQNSTVVQANLNFTGGVIHVIDSVLTLPENATATALAAGLTSLYGALNATGLIDAVDGLSNVTIFAPTNGAFEAIGSGLANLSTADLTSILTYHVVVNQAPLYSTSLSNDTSVATLNGGKVTVTIHNGTVFVNDAKVVTPDVLIAGGVVHVIDQVLNPNNTAIANSSATAGAPAYSGASSVSSAPFASQAPPASTTVAGVASSSSKAGAAPIITGAVGAAALFGAGAAGLIAQL